MRRAVRVPHALGRPAAPVNANLNVKEIDDDNPGCLPTTHGQRLTTGVRHTIRLTPREGMTVAEALAFLADRRAAAQLVDPENCATTYASLDARRL